MDLNTQVVLLALILAHLNIAQGVYNAENYVGQEFTYIQDQRINEAYPASSHVPGHSDGPLLWEEMKNCRRECDDVPKTCYMELVVARYTILGPACKSCENGIIEDCDLPQCITADGYHRSMIAANRRLPSPPLEVCRNDKIVVDVKNGMPDETTTIHWHGIWQVDSQYYDGVPYVTQCPILPGTTFRYQFSVTEPGTFFYHSHTGTQKLDGISGALIVRDIKGRDVYSNLYDEDLSEHVIQIGDWTRIPAENLIPGLHNDIMQAPAAILINGRGKHYDKDSNITLPIPEFLVEQGKRYRFRLISMTCTLCGVSIEFGGHTVTAITSDGGLNIQPMEVKKIHMNSAERFDVILSATNFGGTYPIEVRGVGSGCNLYQKATLRYTTESYSPPVPAFISWNYTEVFNNIDSTCDPTSLGSCMSDIEGTTDAPKITDPNLYHQLVLNFGYTVLTEELFSLGNYISYHEPVKGTYIKPNMNKTSFVFPPSPLISQLNEIPQSYFCSEKCKRGEVETFCMCTNIYDVKLNAVVDMIITDTDGKFRHPFHLHGKNFFVLEMKGNVTNWPEELGLLKDKLLRDEINTNKRPERDTVTVPSGGYAAVRFIANNPGFWIFHCHFAFHLEGGMAAVLKIGELSDFPPVPKNFPRCGNFS